jgi:uncharacterized protein (DUF488 family)
MNSAKSLYTIGHSSQSIEAFLELLHSHQIQMVVDVRSQPYSRRYPHFSREALQKSLGHAAIRYLFLGRELGARRDEPQCYVDGLASYQEIAKLPNFLRGIERVLETAQRSRVALTCAEYDPLTCHRTILICRELRARDVSIQHILRDGSLEDHTQAEQRLVEEELGSRDQADLFTRSDNVELMKERAYRARASRIAFRHEKEH